MSANKFLFSVVAAEVLFLIFSFFSFFYESSFEKEQLLQREQKILKEFKLVKKTNSEPIPTKSEKPKNELEKYIVFENTPIYTIKALDTGKMFAIKTENYINNNCECKILLVYGKFCAIKTIKNNEILIVPISSLALIE